MERMNAWEKYPEGKKRNEVFDFAEEYRKFLSDCKTERECVTYFAQKAEKAGFVNLDTVLEKGTKLAAGDKVYANNMGKGLALFVIGEKSMEHGMNILGAHIDSPRMDLKQDPLYEDTDFAMLDTHYYGGIKKYQWVTLPLALHGVIAKKDGTVVKVSVGDKPGDPVFGVSDLLIHLSGEQMEKKAAKVIEGEIVLHELFRYEESGEEARHVRGTLMRTGRLMHTEKCKRAGMNLEKEGSSGL